MALLRSVLFCCFLFRLFWAGFLRQSLYRLQVACKKVWKSAEKWKKVEKSAEKFANEFSIMPLTQKFNLNTI